MNIVVVSQYYYPDNFRINGIVAELVKEGHTVKVITGLPDYTTSRIPKEYRFFRKRRETIDGAEVVRVPTIARRKGVFFRALNYASFAISGWLYAAFCSNKDIDAIFVYQVSPVLQGIPAIRLKKRTRAKLTLYCCDLWPESLKAWNVTEKSLLFKLIKPVSRYIYCSCDTVAVTSKTFREYLACVCHVKNQKLKYLPQHAEDIYKHIQQSFENDGCIDFLFAGNVGAVQNVDCIIKAIPHIKTDKKFHIHIVGNGSEFDFCTGLAKELGISDDLLTFHGRHSLNEMYKFYAKADCLLLTLVGGSFIGETLPAKTQGYLSSGKPIIGAINGSGKAVLEEADCGLCGPAGDYEKLAENMTEMIEHFDDYKDKGINGREYYNKHFRKEIFMDNLMKML